MLSYGLKILILFFQNWKLQHSVLDVLKCCVMTLVNSSLQFLNKMWILTCFYGTSVLISQNYPTQKIFCQEVFCCPVLQFFKYYFSFIWLWLALQPNPWICASHARVADFEVFVFRWDVSSAVLRFLAQLARNAISDLQVHLSEEYPRD